ncbi:MAG: class I SAM-dependent methyltransferase [Pseudomonadota bacterium]
MPEIPARFVDGLPAPQNAVDLFKGQWLSNLPVPGVVSGPNQLHYDERIEWFLEQIGSVRDLRVLELGPLESGHSWMLEKAGVQSVTAIEANSTAYLRCLIAKELTNLTRTRFLLGNFVDYLRQSDEKFDICIACGVLYHMVAPIELIELISKHANKVMIWTHYYDQAAIEANPKIRPDKFSAYTQTTHAGFDHEIFRYEYLDALALENFSGGLAEYSHWIKYQTLIDALHFFGFDQVREYKNVLDSDNGPNVTLAAWKSEVQATTQEE